MKYRRKPDTVDAEQFDPEADWPAGVWDDDGRYKVATGGAGCNTIKAGDWIVTDGDGQIEVLTDKEFRTLYEREGE